jgi:hypothetical protein
MQLHGDLAERYRDFADYARGDSPCFESWARRVAEDPAVLGWLADLPETKQQPNLVFAAARWHGAPAPGPYDGLRAILLEDTGAVRRTVMERATQTNEVGRLATITPLLATVPGPVALLEVGASAGLCLYPDRYDYAWPPLGSLAGSGGPVLRADVDGPVPLPRVHPEIAWRGGIDLNPLDVDDRDAMDWLTTLVWPEQDERRERLVAAISVARADPPGLVRGDALSMLPALLEQATSHGTVVVLHSAVVAYFDDAERAGFAATMRELVASGQVRWISNEAPGVVPGITTPEPAPSSRFVLALDGEPVAWTHGHGSSMRWL